MKWVSIFSRSSYHPALKIYIRKIPQAGSFDIFLSFSKLWIYLMHLPRINFTFLRCGLYFVDKRFREKSSKIENFEKLLKTEYCCITDKIFIFLSTFCATLLSMSMEWRLHLKIKIPEKIIKMIELFDFLRETKFCRKLVDSRLSRTPDKSEFY